MIMKPVNSDGVVAAGFTKDFIQVEFNCGRVHNYYQVPFGIYSDFLNSSSKATFMNLVLKH